MKTVSYTLLFTLLVAALIISAIWYTQTTDFNPAPIETQSPTPTPTSNVAPTSTSNPPLTPNTKLTVTYSEISRNESVIVIHFKLEPNSYIFQINATSFHLLENGSKISTNTNDALVIGTQYSTLIFPTNNYSGSGYYLTSNVFPSDTIWIKQ